MEAKYQKFFLGANSCEGFVSEFPGSYRAADGWHAYIVKGGPGTGKSSMMKYAAAKLHDAGQEVLLCPCSSDPQSLDGVILPARKTVILDGTAPHVVEPEFPGACEEIVNLGDFWDGTKLRANAAGILAATAKNKALHRMAARYLSACGQLLRDNLRIAEACTDTDRAERFAEGLCRKYLPVKKGGKGSEWVRFLQGITPLGVMAYTDTVTGSYRTRVILSDEYGSVSGAVMAKLRAGALAAGYEIITVKSAFLPGELTDHILIPELSLAFVTESDYMHFDSPERRIHARRFMNTEQLHASRQRLGFNKRMIRELLLLAAETIAAAKKVHDGLEKYYIDAMDFKALTAFSETFAEKLLSGEK